MTTKPLVFISHITEEQDLAVLIKDEILEANLLGCVDVFVSSDSRVNSGGQSWLKNIEDALQRASVFLILASPASIVRPWINIEAGAGWLRQLQAQGGEMKPVYVMPLCHSGQHASKLPKPWDTLNAVECNSIKGLQEILNIVGTTANLTKIPKPNFDVQRGKIADLEMRYSYLKKIENAIVEIITTFPQFKPVFLGQVPPDKMVRVEKLPQHEVDNLYRARQHLEGEGLIIFRLGGVHRIVGGSDTGTWTELGMSVTPKYMADVLGKITLP